MKEDELVLCTVENVTNTITNVRLPDGREGTIISSEIAPGRIKFMRQYVFPNKRIVCKVLKDTGERVHLSLRRVNAKERNEVIQGYKQELSLHHGLKQLLGTDYEAVKEKILQSYPSINDFITKTKEQGTLLTTFIPQKHHESFHKLTEKKKKKQEIKKIAHLKSLDDDGVERIKNILNLGIPELEITYLAAGEFMLKLTVEEFKQGKKRMLDIEQELEARTKKQGIEFSMSEKQE